VAGDGGLEPSELVVPDPAAEAPGATGANGPPTGPNGQPPGANGTNGQPTAITESGRKKPG